MSAKDVQALLRLMTAAKVPLVHALAAVHELRSRDIDTTERLARSDLTTLKDVFKDDKLCKQILSAAKRSAKRRASGDDGPSTTPTKRRKADPFETPDSVPAWEVEKSLETPMSNASEEELRTMSFITNRAPLVLAFVIVLISHTMPEQPQSSRLSLAQAVVSEGAKSKAKSIGLSKGDTAEEEGWGQGQPVVTIMGRDIRVLKRWGYVWGQEGAEGQKEETTVEDVSPYQAMEDQPALWGVDLDQMKALNGPVTFSAASSDTKGLPVYSPKGARSYLYRSFETAETELSDGVKGPKKRTNALAAAEREQNVSHLLRALDLLFESWKTHLSSTELDKRSWTWYCTVRPQVSDGISGWGAKGKIRLAEILDLRRKD